ncbi:MAG: CDP-alcohol phosphatidyltransferase family protein [Acidimicrobiia bacterium]
MTQPPDHPDALRAEQPQARVESLALGPDDRRPAPASERDGEDRVLTVPNLITVVRLCLMPVFLWLLFGREDRASAAWLLAGLGITDFLDGWIARRFHQVSNLGKVLDPVADRLLFILGVGGIVIDGSVPTWFAVAVLVREGLVGGATITLGLLGVRRIDVTWFGKAYTLLLMLAFPLFLASHSTLGWADGARTAAWIFGVPGLAFSYWSAVLYVPLARRALRERDLTSEVAA